jgi:hypothetical protein
MFDAEAYDAERDLDDADFSNCTFVFTELSSGAIRFAAARAALDALTREP